MTSTLQKALQGIFLNKDSVLSKRISDANLKNIFSSHFSPQGSD